MAGSPSSVSEKQFQEVLQQYLDISYDRALAVFRNYGNRLSYDVTNVLLHASDKGKVSEVLEILEEHYKNHLNFQHPRIRGTVADGLGINLTEDMFLRICEKTLGLKKNPA